MTPFDDRFADRVREAFDAYEEPVDPAALERMRAALATHPAPPSPAADRAPIARQRTVRRRWAGVAALAAFAVAGGLWLQQLGPAPATAPSTVAEATASSPAPPRDTAEQHDALPRTTPRPGRAAPEATGPRSLAPSGAGRSGNEPPSVAEAAPPGPPARREALGASGSQEPGSSATALARVAVTDPESPPLADPLDPVDAAESSADPERVAARRSRSVFDRDRPAPETTTLVGPRDPAEPSASGFRVVASASAVSGGAGTEGTGVSAGLAREWAVGRGVSVSGGAAVAYNRLVSEPTAALASADFETAGPVDVVTRSTLTTLAVEIPFDIAADVARVPGGRVGLSVGLTSALYLDQTFDDEGQTYSGAAVAVRTFAERETVGPLRRIDLARQLNLGLRFTAGGAAPVSVDLYGRLSLRGVTSRDLPLTALGLRLRYGL